MVSYLLFTSVLVLAGIELIFFLVVDTALCFGFTRGIMLMTHWCFVCCWVVFNPKWRTCQFPLLCQWGGAWVAWKDHGQDSWPEQAKGIFHAVEHHVQYINWGELSGSCWFLLGDRLAIGQVVVNYCILRHLFFFSCVYFSLTFPLQLYLLFQLFL